MIAFNGRSPLPDWLILVVALLFLSTQPVQASADDARLRDELDQMLVRLAQDGALGPDAVTIEAPARRVANFGALIDRDHHDGLLVLGVLPGGGAEALGLHTGDRLLAANAVDLGGPGGSDRLRSLLSVLDNGEQITLRVARDGQTLALSGAMEVHELPAARLDLAPGSGRAGAATDPESSCARISAFPAAPTAADLFPVAAVNIDGHSGTRDQDSFRVAPGRRVISVAENIDSRWFSPVANRQRSSGGRDRYKSLEIDVRAGVTYFIAARFHREQADRIAEGSYWEPVVWKERAERCR